MGKEEKDLQTRIKERSHTIKYLLNRQYGYPLGLKQYYLMKKLLYAILLGVCFHAIISTHLHGQTEYRFSLDEAIAYALENNYDLLSSYKDIETAEKQVKEYLAIGFPQIDAKVNYTDYIALPTMIIPAGSFGADSPEQEIQFGTKYNASADATASQLIFDGKYVVGVQASKRLLEKNQQQFIKLPSALDDRQWQSLVDVQVLLMVNDLTVELGET